MTSPFAQDTPTPTPGITPVATAQIPAEPTVGPGTPTPFSTISLAGTSLAGITLFVPNEEFPGATFTVSEVGNIPPTPSGSQPFVAFAIQVSDLASCVSGITVSMPVPIGMNDPEIVVFINGGWQTLSTTVTNGVAVALITCEQLAAAGRTASGDVLVGLVDKSQLVVPAMSHLALAVLLITLTALIVRRRFGITSTQRQI